MFYMNNKWWIIMNHMNIDPIQVLYYSHFTVCFLYSIWNMIATRNNQLIIWGFTIN